MYGAEIESVQYKRAGSNGQPRVVSGLITVYHESSGLPIENWAMEINAPVTNVVKSSLSSQQFALPASYKLQASFAYSASGALVMQKKVNDMPQAALYDFNQLIPVMEAANAEPSDIGYTSFETDETPGFNTATLPVNRVPGGFKGAYAFRLGSSTNGISKSGLQVGSEYAVEYWSQNGAVSITNQVGVSATQIATGPVVNGWTRYRHLIPPGTTSLSISASNAVIDELMCAPAKSAVTSGVYLNYSGLQIAREDEKGNIVHIEYDGYWRPIILRDERKDIVKQISYNYGNSNVAVSAPPATIYYNAAQSRVVSKNDGCPAGASPLPLTYTVPYGKHASVTEAGAVALAVAELDAEAQNYANAVGKCVYYNDASTGSYSKNDCDPATGFSVCNSNPQPRFNSFITYTVPAGYLYSEISKSDANALALQVRNAQGQAQANSQCWCSCSSEGQKMINFVCEVGVRYNVGSTFKGNGQWECTYYYVFSDGSISDFYTSLGSSPCPIY